MEDMCYRVNTVGTATPPNATVGSMRCLVDLVVLRVVDSDASCGQLQQQMTKQKR